MSAQYLPELPDGYIWRIDRLRGQFGIYRDYDLYIGIIRRDHKAKPAFTNGDNKSSAWVDRFWIVDPDHKYVPWNFFKFRKRGERFTTKWDLYVIEEKVALRGAKPSREEILLKAEFVAGIFYRQYNYETSEKFRSDLIGNYPPKNLIDVPSEEVPG